MKTIKLFGDLQAFKSEWLLNVQTPAEALRAINANRPGFLAAADQGEYVLVLVDEHNPERTRAVTMDTATAAWADEALWVVPRISGETGAEIVAAVAGTAFAATTAGIVIAAVINIVISVALSMIASLISGTNDGMSVDNSEPYESKPSYLFNGAVNTTRQGHRMPLLYGGPMLVGSMTLSADINVKDIPA